MWPQVALGLWIPSLHQLPISRMWSNANLCQQLMGGGQQPNPNLLFSACRSPIRTRAPSLARKKNQLVSQFREFLPFPLYHPALPGRCEVRSFSIFRRRSLTCTGYVVPPPLIVPLSASWRRSVWVLSVVRGRPGDSHATGGCPPPRGIRVARNAQNSLRYAHVAAAVRLRRWRNWSCDRARWQERFHPFAGWHD